MELFGYALLFELALGCYLFYRLMRSTPNNIQKIIKGVGFTFVWLALMACLTPIPGDLRGKGTLMFSAALETMATIKVAEEMYAVDNDEKYTDDIKRLTQYMTTTCKDPEGKSDGCIDKANGMNLLEQHLKKIVDEFDMTFNASGTEFILWGVAKDRDTCHICIGSNGTYLPTSYSGCDIKGLDKSYDPDCKNINSIKK